MAAPTSCRPLANATHACARAVCQPATPTCARVLGRMHLTCAFVSLRGACLAVLLPRFPLAFWTRRQRRRLLERFSPCCNSLSNGGRPSGHVRRATVPATPQVAALSRPHGRRPHERSLYAWRQPHGVQRPQGEMRSTCGGRPMISCELLSCRERMGIGNAMTHGDAMGHVMGSGDPTCCGDPQKCGDTMGRGNCMDSGDPMACRPWRPNERLRRPHPASTP